MASKEFHAMQEAMAARPVPPPPADIAEQRSRIDEAMAQMPLAEGTVAEPFVRSGVPGIECRPVELADDAPIVLYFHGGGFRIASALAYRSYGSHLAAVLGARVLLVEYRLAPENKFPKAVDDCFTVWESLLAEGIDTGRIVIAGDSAGGGLAASVTMHALADGVLPAGVICCSPWVDLTITADTYDTNAESDKLFSRTSAEEAAPAYLGSADPMNPIASPLFGDWDGAPPLLILVGDAEVLLDDSRKLAEVAKAAGVDVTLSIYPEMPHIWTMSYPAFPEAVEGVTEMAEFVARVTA
ncbi:MAG: alpha/beta hydrolase [Acidimicrobiia bacterium]|nr:alpha/beta hydrolase [Acidimicrobiia bacterium]